MLVTATLPQELEAGDDVTRPKLVITHLRYCTQKRHHIEKEKSHSPSLRIEDHKRDHNAHRSHTHHYRSPTHRQRSHTHRQKSPSQRHRSPTHRNRSPHRHRSPTHRRRSRSPVQKPSNSRRQQKSKQEEGIKSVASEPNSDTTKTKISAEEVNITQSLPMGNRVQPPVANKKKLLWGSKPVVKSWNNWEGASFEGDEAAQSKFRRLMGIKGSSSDEKAPNKGVAATSTVLKHLETQYETSRFMTHLAKGAGLGFGVAAQITPTTFDPKDTDNLNE